MLAFTIANQAAYFQGSFCGGGDRNRTDDKGFADLCLTTWLRRRPLVCTGERRVERETGFEPATSTLARSHSTTELFPLARRCYTRRWEGCQTAGDRRVPGDRAQKPGRKASSMCS